MYSLKCHHFFNLYKYVSASLLLLYGSCHQSMRTLLNLQYLTTCTLLTLYNFYILGKNRIDDGWWWYVVYERQQASTFTSVEPNLSFGAKYMEKNIETIYKRTKTAIIIIFCWCTKNLYCKNLLVHLLT